MRCLRLPGSSRYLHSQHNGREAHATTGVSALWEKADDFRTGGCLRDAWSDLLWSLFFGLKHMRNVVDKRDCFKAVNLTSIIE